jgi:hypothetical protein
VSCQPCSPPVLKAGDNGQLLRRHNYKLCYTVTRLSLKATELVAKAKRRGAHRKKRVRRPLPGMLFQDGSTHWWIAALAGRP